MTHSAKLLLGIVLVLLPATWADAQSLYYDAISLRTQTENRFVGNRVLLEIGTDVTGEVVQILKKYSKKANPSPSELEAEFAGNPFLNITGAAQHDAALKAIFSSASKGSTLMPGLSGLPVTTVADGLAKFLVERTKQELSITFFQKFKEFLDSDQAKDFNTLFPHTKSVLNIIDQEIYQYSSYLQTLRESFVKDLENLMDRLPLVIEDNVSGSEKEYILLALSVVNQLRSGEHPAVILERLALHSFPPGLQSIEQGMKLMRIVSSSIRSQSSDHYWVEADSLNLLFNEATFKIYLGLMYQLHGEEEIGDKKLKDYLTLLAGAYENHYKAYISFINEIALKAENINLALDELRRKKGNDGRIDSYFTLFNSTISLLGSVQKINDLPLGITIGDELTLFIARANAVSSLYLDLNERRYNAAIVELSNLLKDILGDRFLCYDEFIKYGTFIANVAQAESSHDVQAAIEAVALPVGSASIKRKSKFNISLNAFVGVSPGYEYNGETGQWRAIFGVVSPVGVAASWGHGKGGENCNCSKGASSIFFSLVDIGAFSTVRFNDPNTEELPEVTFGNIFAPGLYYVYGIPRVPLSMGIGGQLGPQLRDLTEAVPPSHSDLNGSFRFFIAVDIPLLNFYTKSR